MSETIGIPLRFTFSDGTLGCPLYLGQVDDVDFQSIFIGGFAIGNPVIRSAYVVYDVNNNEISFAQAAFNSTGKDNIQEIPVGSGVPGMTSTATATATQLPTSAPPSLLSQLSASLSDNQTATIPVLTAITQLPITPSSPSFDIAAATGSAATATSSSSSARRSFGIGAYSGSSAGCIRGGCYMDQHDTVRDGAGRGICCMLSEAA